MPAQPGPPLAQNPGRPVRGGWHRPSNHSSRTIRSRGGAARVPGPAASPSNAHKELQQILIAACGAFDVLLDDGLDKKVFFDLKTSNDLILFAQK